MSGAGVSNGQRVCFVRLVLNAELMLEGIRQNIASPSREGIVLLCSAVLCSEAASPRVLGIVLGTTISKKGIKDMEMNGLEGKPYEEWMRSLFIFSLEKRMKANLISFYSFFMSGKQRSRL